MDSLIRLDAVTPITPLSESRPTINIRSPVIDNLRNTNPPQTVIDVDNSVNLEEMPSVIDLTHSEEFYPNTDNWSIGSNPPVVINLDYVDRESFSAKSHAPVKHKLSPLSNHNPPKVPRITGSDLNFPILNTNGNFQSVTRPTFSHENSYPITTTSSLMKNHTVTSADVNNDVQVGLEPEPLNLATTSRETNTFVTCANRQNISGIAPGQSLAFRSNNFLDSAFFKDPVLDTVKNIQSNLAKQNNTQISNDLVGLFKNREKESAIFYQILDMFPDIDLTFLEGQCRSGLDINQISEIILEMNDYPKAIFQISETLPPKVVVNDNVNNKFEVSPSCSKVVVNDNVNNKFEVSPSCSSSTDNLNLADKLIRPTEMCDTKSIDNSSLINVSNATSSIKVPTSTIINQDEAACQNRGQNKEKDRPSNLIPKDVQMENKGVVINEDRPKRDTSLVKKEEEGDKSEATMISQRNYSFLMGIFPDADPSYMQIKSKLNGNALTAFITENMEKRDYPKVTDSSKLKPVKDENEAGDEFSDVGLYTTNFEIENFIKIFPTPFEYFMDEKRSCQFLEHGLGFLKRRYRNHTLKLILLKYKEYNYNLAKTCAFLDEEKLTRLTKRSLKEIKMPENTNLPFLQEACFIEHKIKIKEYLDGIAEAKRLAYEQAQAKGELIECGCCYQDVLFEDCAACNEGHLFCKTCIRKSVEVRIGDAHTTFPCLQDCGSIFALQLLEVLVDATMFSRLLQRIQMDEVMAADIEGLECCPFCDFAIILPPETNIFKCLNPECLKESCRKCHKLSHIPQRCEEVENDDQARARKYIEDEMTRALVRECYKCKKSFIKIDGCNKMTCTCGAKMCYICRQPIVDYKHFNGPGGGDKKKCPLYSTEKLLHVDAVEAMAKKALEEINSKNPELKLKHDPTKILPPADSAKTTLPPGVNEEAGRLDDLLRYINLPNNGQIQENGVVVQNNIAIIPEAQIRPHQNRRHLRLENFVHLVEEHDFQAGMQFRPPLNYPQNNQDFLGLPAHIYDPVVAVQINNQPQNRQPIMNRFTWHQIDQQHHPPNNHQQ